MGWFLMAVLYVGSTAADYFLRRKKRFDAPPPSGLGDITLPTAEEGRPIPVFWGHCLIKSPNVLWYGDLIADPIGDGTNGYKYSLGMMLGISLGEVDYCWRVFWEDKVAGWNEGPYPAAGPDPVLLHFESPSLFGGEVGGEGGVVGHMRIYFGSADQPANAYLEAEIGKSLPAYRHLAYAVIEHMYLGISPYLKAISFDVGRYPNQLGLADGMEKIGTTAIPVATANPACMIYEALTNSIWGLGWSPDVIDTAAFRAAGETLFAEGLGLSLQVTSDTDIWEAIDDVYRHIDAVGYPDPTTGLYTIKLIRNDYDPGDLLELDDSAIKSLTFDRPSLEKTANLIRLKYLDHGTPPYLPPSGQRPWVYRVASAQDAANIRAQGRVVPQDVEFLGIREGALAQKIAARELKAVSYPFARMSLTVNRKAWSLRPGSVFKLNWAPLGISGMVCRVTRIGFGTLGDGRIRIEAAEDVFGVDWTAYSPPQPSGWEEP